MSGRTVAYYSFIIMVAFNLKEEFLSWKLVPLISSLQVFWSVNFHTILNCIIMQTSYADIQNLEDKWKYKVAAEMLHYQNRARCSCSVVPIKSTKSNGLTFAHDFQEKIVFSWHDCDF